MDPKMSLPFTLDDYNIISFLGKGSYGKVYLVEDKKTSKQYACKHFSLSYSYELKHDIISEMMFYNLVRGNPLFIQNKEIIIRERSIFLIIDLIEKDFSKASKMTFPERISLFPSVFYRLTTSLATVHYLGFTHNDLTPYNLFLNKKKEAFIGDFGIVQANGCQMNKSYAMVSYNYNRNYNSPQVLAQEKEMMEKKRDEYHYEKSDDIYVLGVLLMSFLCGTPPFPQLEIEKNNGDSRLIASGFLSSSQLKKVSTFFPLLDRMISFQPQVRDDLFHQTFYPQISKKIFPRTFAYFPISEDEIMIAFNNYKRYVKWGRQVSNRSLIMYYDLVARFNPSWRKMDGFYDGIFCLIDVVFNFSDSPHNFADLPMKMAVHLDFHLQTCQQEAFFNHFGNKTLAKLAKTLVKYDPRNLNALV